MSSGLFPRCSRATPIKGPAYNSISIVNKGCGRDTNLEHSAGGYIDVDEHPAWGWTDGLEVSSPKDDTSAEI
jgi:hypothetical protein